MGSIRNLWAYNAIMMIKWIAVPVLSLTMGCASQLSSKNKHSTIISPSDFATGITLQDSGGVPVTKPHVNIIGSTVTTKVENPWGGVDRDDNKNLFEPTRIGIPITVEALVGQVNGRPIYANAVLEPLSDQLETMASKMSRSSFYDSLVPARATQSNISSPALYFEIDNMGTSLRGGEMYKLVKNDLLLSEARSGMTKEQEYGLFAIIGQMRTDLASAQGGSQSQMRQEIEEQSGVSLEKFLEFQRDQILIEALDRQEIWPKVNVTWRDIQREFEQVSLGETVPSGAIDKARTDEVVLGLRKLSPLGSIDAARGSITLGMIRLQLDDPRIEVVKQGFAQGLSFAEVADLANIPNSGEWETFEMGIGGIEDIDVADAIKSKLISAKEGETPSPTELSTSIIWTTIMHQQKPISMYNRRIQIALRNALWWLQFNREKDRFVKSLWGEGSTHEVKAMAERVADIAVQRYYK